MKTTLDIPDEIFKQAKVLAVTQGISLKQLVSEALQDKLSANAHSSSPKPWMKLAGIATSELREELNRMDQIINDEFSRIDEEDWK